MGGCLDPPGYYFEVPGMKSQVFPGSNGFSIPPLQSGCTERSTHTRARVLADLAQGPDGGGKVEGGSGEGFHTVLHKET